MENVKKISTGEHVDDISAEIDIRQVLDGLPDPALLVDKNGNVILYNTAFYDFFGIRPRQLPQFLEESKSFKDVFKALFDIDNEAVAEMFVNPAVKHIADLLHKCEDGNSYKGMRSYIPVMTKNKKCCAVIVHYRDNTPEARMQERYEKVLIVEKKYADDLEKKVSEKTEKLTQALRNVTILSQTDMLTGLLNRQVFMECTNKSIEIAQSYDEGLGILMFDLDYFKKVNDSFGHQAGDRILQEATKLLKSLIRETDIMGRYGGEEFVACVKGATLGTIEKLCFRILESMRQMPVENIVPGKTTLQTISIGCALFPQHGTTLPQLIKCADDALYKAKALGRDRFVIYFA